jgi:hypothetical protein
MNRAKLHVLGVFRPQITKEAWDEQWQVTEDDDETQAYFDSLVLIEAVVDGLDGPFEMIRFGQMHPDFPNDPEQMLVGYDEGLLSGDGETLIQRQMDCVHGTCPLRFAAYLQYYDPKRPLMWQGGEVTAPAMEIAPNRLMSLMPYSACT